MKTWMKMLIAVAVMAMMAACHPDEKNNKKPGGTVSGEPDNSVFLSLNVALPPAGPAAKAGEDDSPYGSEQGTEEESKVSTMLVVLADKDNHRYITHGTLVNPTASQGSVTGVASMDRNGLTKYYGDNNDNGSLKSGKDLIDVFVFCNYTQELLEAVRSSGQSTLGEEAGASSSVDWIHAAGTVANKIDESIWSNGYFLMSNQSIATRQIPTSEAEWNKYGEESSSFNLCGANGAGINNGSTNQRGPIKVQRVMARIDLKDASGGETPEWTYPIQTTGTGNGELRVKIERVALVNQSKYFLFLKHVAKPGVTSAADLAKWENDSVCGPEVLEGLEYPYVVDADVKEEYKQQTQSDDEIAIDATSKAFRYPLFDGTGAIDNTVRQQWDASPTSTFGTSYKAWTYVTENTTPHTSNRAGITTGVVFKGRLVAEAAQNVNTVLVAAANGNYGDLIKEEDRNKYYLTKVAQNDDRIWPLLYAFGETGRKIYVGWNDQVKDEVKKQMGGTDNPGQAEIDALPEGTIAYAYYRPVSFKLHDGQEVEKTPKEMFEALLAVQQNASSTDQQKDDARDDFKAAAVAAGFTVYQAGLATEDWAFEDGAVGQDDNDAGYFCYYFYWIRHNLAESIGTVYPMEYAVVRNNVYKLSIQSIRRFGHPRLSSHDTDPMTVNTPCEKSELYMTVDVRVADWVTRESSIIL